MAKTQTNEETVAGYFRAVFAENPKLVHARSNQELLDRWLADHPGETEVPGRVRANLQNLKNTLRKQAQKKRGRPKKSAGATTATTDTAAQAPATDAFRPVIPTTATADELEQLEQTIDDCLSMAKYIDVEGLRDVASLLRKARNVVVWKQTE